MSWHFDQQALDAEAATDGWYAGRPAIPTGKLILGALPGIRLIPDTGQSPPTILQPPPTFNLIFWTCSTSIHEISADDHSRRGI